LQGNRLSSALYGDAQPTTDEGRYGVAVARYLPAAFVPGMGGLSAALGSGIGEEAAKDMGYSPLLGALVGGSLPGAVKSGAGYTLKKGLTAIGLGDEAEAGRKAALELIGKKGAQQILDTPLNTSEFGKYMRTAEILPDHQMAALTAKYEGDVSKKLLGDLGETAAEVMAKKDAARSAAQILKIESNLPAARLPEVGGGILRTAIKEGEKNATEVVGAAYTQAVKAKPVMSLPKELSPLLTKVKASGAISDEAAKAADNLRFAIKKADGKVDTEIFKNAREIIGKEVGPLNKAFKNGTLLTAAQSRARSQLNNLYGQLKEVTKQNPALVRADKLMREKGTTFRTRSNKKILATEDTFGNYKMLESKIPAQVTSSPEAIKQVFKAFNTKSIIGQNASEAGRAREVIARTLADDVLIKNSKDMAGNLTPTNFSKNLSALRASGKAREIYTRDQMTAFSIVEKDLKSKAAYLARTRLGSAGGSQTAEKTTNAAALVGKAAIQTLYRIPIIGPGLEAASINKLARINAFKDDAVIRSLADQSFAKDFVRLAQREGKPAKALVEKLGNIVAQSAAKAIAQNKEEFMTEDKPASADTAGLSKLIDQVGKAIGPSEAQAMEPVAAKETALPRSLVNAVIHQESRGNPNAVSPKGAQGLMQIMPATAKEIAAELGVTDYDLKDRETNQRFGEYYLAKQLKRFGTPELALAAYNAGPGKVQMWINKYGPSWDAISKGIADDIAARRLNREYYRETLNYVPSIMKRVVSV